MGCPARRSARPWTDGDYLARLATSRLVGRAGGTVARRQQGSSHIARLLAALSPTAGLVTVIDASPVALSWIGGVRGNRLSPLGVDRFGQTGDLPDLYREYRLDTQAILDAIAELFL